MNILSINPGSSSIKCCLYQVEHELSDTPPEPTWQGEADWSSEQGEIAVAVMTVQGSWHHILPAGTSRQTVFFTLLVMLWEGPSAVLAHPTEIALVGHRVVHGGADYQQATRVTREVKAAIERLIPLAPLHNSASLECITLSEQLFPGALQIAVFDTAFHRQMPRAATVYPGPYRWFEQGIQRYGFHGINHQYCAARAAQLLKRDPMTFRVITCHLGNGCSLAAVAGGRCLDTTMGFTPLDGVMMGTRPGALDPGILLYLLQQQSVSVEQLAHLLQTESGLKGISGISSDMRQILQACEKGHERARLALEIYLHRLCAGIGALLPTLGGIDALVFTGGIGEHAAEVRARTCDAFAFLGLRLDSAQNARSPHDHDIATPESCVRVMIVHAQETWAIAQECWRLALIGSEQASDRT